MFRQVWTVALVVMVTVGILAVATAEEPKKAGGKTKTPPTMPVAEVGTADVKKDLDNMQGTWTVVVAEREGKKAPDGAIKAMKVVIKGDSLILTDGDHEEKCSLKVNPSVKPKSLDLLPGRENQKEKAVHGIYELTTSTLKMCWTKNGGERPREFATKPASDMAMFVLERNKQ